MVAGSSFVNLFGAGPIVPAQPSYEALTIASNTALVWPQETTGGSPYVAAQIDVTASAPNLSLMFPPGNTGSTGGQSLVTNVGADSFTVTDQAGNQIAVIASTQTWLITLIDNSTPNGSWRAYQLAATTSSGSAGALAGPGLQAVGSELQTIWSTTYLDTDSTLTASDRSTAVIWNGDAGALSLDTVANLTVGWFCGIANQGTGAVTITASDGSTINGVASLVVPPGDSGIIICAAGAFNTVGALITTLAIASGGSGAATAAQALVNFGGSAVGISIFTAPNVAAIVALLGLSNLTFTESSVATDQTLAAISTNTIYVCTATLALTLPLTSTLTKSFVFMASAQGGAVTLSPQAADAINGGSAGDGVVIPEGGWALVSTDMAGNWWTLFGPVGTFSSLTITGITNFGSAGTFFANPDNSGSQLLEFSSGNYIQFTPGVGFSFLSGGEIVIDAASGVSLEGGVTMAGGAGVSGGLTVTTGGLNVAAGNAEVSGTLGVSGATTGVAATYSGQVLAGGAVANPILSSGGNWAFYVGGAASAWSSSSAATLSLGTAATNLEVFYSGPTTVVGSITTNGTVTAFNTTSDATLKIDDGPIMDSGWIIDRLKPLMFRWKSSPDIDSEPGFFAQQVARVFPWAVTPGKGRRGSKKYIPWQMDSGKFMPVVVAELQSVRRELRALKKQLAALEKRYR